jgi:hypothetical protein
VAPRGSEDDTSVAPPAPVARFGLLAKFPRICRPAKLPRRAMVALVLLGAGMVLVPLTKRGPFESVGLYLRQRSTIEVADDFRSGLSGWTGAGGWATEWAYEPAGSIRPGKLALLSASMPLADYRLEFLGEIQNKSLCWAFRASDARNYYAMKITIAKPGPLPVGAIVRYAVVDGVPTGRVQLPLPLSIRNDTTYHVETMVFQDRFTTSVNGQVVDTFIDRRHRCGGVGLFSEPGEGARVFWVRVTDQDDIWGRICAYFSGRSADSRGGRSR